jgi:hypothetical protein
MYENIQFWAHDWNEDTGKYRVLRRWFNTESLKHSPNTVQYMYGEGVHLPIMLTECGVPSEASYLCLEAPHKEDKHRLGIVACPDKQQLELHTGFHHDVERIVYFKHVGFHTPSSPIPVNGFRVVRLVKLDTGEAAHISYEEDAMAALMHRVADLVRALGKRRHEKALRFSVKFGSYKQLHGMPREKGFAEHKRSYLPGQLLADDRHPWNYDYRANPRLSICLDTDHSASLSLWSGGKHYECALLLPTANISG